MASRIAGITIEISGNTTELQKSLDGVNKKLRSTSTALKDVNKLLKLNPGNTDLLRQKQQYLTTAIDETKKKLQQEKAALEQLKAANTTGEITEDQKALEREIIATEGELKKLQKEYKDFGSVGAQQLQAVGDKVKAVGDKIAAVGSALTKTVTAPIVGIFTAGGKAALDYGDAIAKVATIADTSAVPVAEFHDQILQLSNDTGKSATELAEAVYQAISASVDTKDAVQFVATATNLAKAGFLDSASAVDVLTTIINAYGKSAEDAELIADQLVQTQNKGKTTVQELAANMGTVIPTAAGLNISLEQLNTAYSIMTRGGINTANATTYLNGMFSELSDTGSGVAKILQEKTGKTFGQLMADGQSLGDVLGILNESVDGNREAFINLWGNARAGRGALSIVKEGAQGFNDELAEMQGALGNVGTALENLDTPGARARKALNRLTNAGIEIGDRLAPIIEKAADLLTGLADKWDALDPKTKDAIVRAAGIAAAVGPVLLIGGKLISGIGGLIIKVGLLTALMPVLLPLIGSVIAAAAPVILIGAGIAAAIAGIIYAGVQLVKHWDEIKEAAGQLKDTVVEKWENLKASTAEKWEGIKQDVQEKASGIKQDVLGKWEEIKKNAKEKWENIKQSIVGPIEAAQERIRSAIEKIKGFFNVKLEFPHINLPHFRVSGGVVPWGLGGKGTPPSIAIDWYKKAYQNPVLFRQPTVLQTSAGLKGFGDGAGAEIVMGLDKLRQLVGANQQQPSVQIGKVDIVIEGAGKNADQIARELQNILNRKAVAYA